MITETSPPNQEARHLVHGAQDHDLVPGRLQVIIRTSQAPTGNPAPIILVVRQPPATQLHLVPQTPPPASVVLKSARPHRRPACTAEPLDESSGWMSSSACVPWHSKSLALALALACVVVCCCVLLLCCVVVCVVVLLWCCCGGGGGGVVCVLWNFRGCWPQTCLPIELVKRFLNYSFRIKNMDATCGHLLSLPSMCQDSLAAFF